MNTPENTTIFRKRLMHLIDTEGMSVDDFALAINRSLQSVNRYLKQGDMPKADVIIAIVRLFPHWSLDYLVGGVGAPVRATGMAAPVHTYAQQVNRWLSKKQVLQQCIRHLPDQAHIALAADTAKEVGELLEYLTNTWQRLEQVKRQINQEHWDR